MDLWDVQTLMFFVGEDRSVFLIFGATAIKVCESPEDFDDFREEMVGQLSEVADEIRGHYCQE